MQLVGVRFLFSWVFIATVLLMGSSRAQAQAVSKTVVVVIDPGETDILMESLVRSMAEAELKKRGYVIVESAEVGGEIPSRLLACAGDRMCMVTALAGITADFVIFISLRPDEVEGPSNFKIVARNYEVATGTALARTMRRCVECKEGLDLAGFSESLIRDLVSEKVAPSPAPEQPSPAPEQSSPAEQPTPAPVEPMVRVESDSRGGFIGTLKYISLAGGVLGLAGGTALVLIDGPIINDSLREPDAYDTLTLGYATLASGGVLLAMSAWLWASDHDDTATDVSIRPDLRPGAAGGSLVLSGEF